MTPSQTLAAVRSGKIWNFHGGIHPDQHKDTAASPIQDLPLPNILVVPLRQHSTRAGELLVKEGDHVLRGQPLTLAVARGAIPVHAPTSGTVKSVSPARASHPSGLKAPAVTIIPDGEDQWIPLEGHPNWQEEDPAALAELVCAAGVAGMGGAGYPAGHKLLSARGKISILIINGCECEPYLTADDALMRGKAPEVVEGIRIVQHILKPEITLLALEDNKPEAAAAMEQAIRESGGGIELRILPTIYPTGAARPLIRRLTGMEVGYDNRSNDFGVTMHNVASCHAIREAVVLGRPSTERVVTLAGENFRQPGNYLIRHGTLLKHLINHVGLKDEKIVHMILGGPMMGFSAPGMDTPLVKTTGCVIAPSRKELPLEEHRMACIKCGRCQEVCPSNLVPYMLLSHSVARNFQGLEDCHFKDCIQCGCCTYVCSSSIPLVMEFRKAKAEMARLRREEQLRQQNQELIAFREQRLAREQEERKARIQALKARGERPAPEAGEIPEPRAWDPVARKTGGAAPADSAATPAAGSPVSAASPAPAAGSAAARAKALALAKAKAAQAQKGAAENAGTETPAPAASPESAPAPAASAPAAGSAAARAKALALAKAKAAQAQKNSAGNAGSESPAQAASPAPATQASAPAPAATADATSAPAAPATGSAPAPADPATRARELARAKALALAKARAAQAQKGAADTSNRKNP